MDKTKAQVDELTKILNSNLDLEAKIEKIESLRVQYAMKGKYDEAKLCAAKTKELKGDMKTNKKVDLEEQHKSESENLEQQFQQELENLNTAWDKKLQDLIDKHQKAETAAVKRQEDEMEKLYSSFESKFSPKIKYSKEYLALENQEEMLSKIQKFDEAKVIRKKKEAVKKKDIEKWNKEKREKIQGQVAQKKLKHDNEKELLKKKLNVEKDLLNVERQKQLQFLEKKYHNKKQELDLQQKNERNLADNDLINKKKQFGLSYMVTNDTHHFRNNTGSNMPSKNINSNQNSSSKKETFPVKIDNGAECDVDLKDLLKPDFALDGIDEAGQEEINIQK